MGAGPENLNIDPSGNITTDYSLGSAKRIMLFQWGEGQGPQLPALPQYPSPNPLRGLVGDGPLGSGPNQHFQTLKGLGVGVRG